MEEQYLDEDFKKEPTTIGNIGIGHILKRVEEHKQVRGIHTELQDLVAQLRREYGETAKKGKGSFGFYMGFLKRFNISEVYSMRKVASTAKNPAKTFWWMVGDRLKKRKVSQVTSSPELSTD